MSYSPSFDLDLVASASHYRKMLAQNYPLDTFLSPDGLWIENIDPSLRQSSLRQPHLSNQTWQHQQQQQPLQRFITEPERPLFMAYSPANLPRSFQKTEVISSLPNANTARMVSPSLSYEPSSCSSARSPETELESYNDSYYPRLMTDSFSFSNPATQHSQGLPQWKGNSQSGAFLQMPTGYRCVNMSQVQVYADPQDGLLPDEGYVACSLPDTYSLSLDHIKAESRAQGYYNTPSDSGFGASTKAASETVPEDDDEDEDAEGEVEDDFPPEPEVEEDFEDPAPEQPEEDEDEEYTPRGTRTRKRSAPKYISKTSQTPSKRTRVSKALPSTLTHPNIKSRVYTCKLCPSSIHSTFSDAASLQRHTNASHARAYVCVFGFAGCESTFASKNEWKRHVSSQHLGLSSWVCELDGCAKATHPDLSSSSVQNHSAKKMPHAQLRALQQGGGRTVALAPGAEFNRKDLFTQHLRRMHAPSSLKAQHKRSNTSSSSAVAKTPKSAAWEERVKNLQSTCHVQKRQPPTQLGCPMTECAGVLFEGQNAWDERMEHVGKHLEKVAAAREEADGDIVDGLEDVRQENDDLLLEWAVRERVVESVKGRWKLFGSDWGEREDGEWEVDAEGESDEYS